MDKITIYFIVFILIIDTYCIITSKKIKISHKYYGKLNKEEIFSIENSIKAMDGREFEEFIGFILEKTGHNVIITPATNDGGKDLILNKDTYIECKAYSEENTIGRPTIQKLIGASVTDEIYKGILVTTSSLTSAAIECIEKCKIVDIEVWYLNDILDICKEIDKNEFEFISSYEIP